MPYSFETARMHGRTAASGRMLLPSHTCLRTSIIVGTNRRGGSLACDIRGGEFRILDWMGSGSGPLPRRHCGKGQRRSRALSIDPFFGPDCSRSAWGAAANSLMRSAASGLPWVTAPCLRPGAGAWAGFLRLDVSNIGQTYLSTAAHHPSGRKVEAPSSCHSANPSEREGFPGMSDPSPLVFELCTAIDRFYERERLRAGGAPLSAPKHLRLHRGRRSRPTGHCAPIEQHSSATRSRRGCWSMCRSAQSCIRCSVIPMMRHSASPRWAHPASPGFTPTSPMRTRPPLPTSRCC